MTKKIKPIDKIRKIIDGLAKLKTTIKELTSKKEDYDTLLKNYILTKELGDDTDAILLGEDYQVEVGIAGSKRTISDLPKVRKILGDKAFMGVATVSLKDIDQYLSEEQQEEVLTLDRTETRVMKFKQAEKKSTLKKKKAKKK